MILILNRNGPIQVDSNFHPCSLFQFFSIDLFGAENDHSWGNIEKARNMHYQKQLAHQISRKMTEAIALISAVLNIHLNMGQNLTINTPSVFMSWEAASLKSLSNKRIEQVGGAHIRVPSSFNAPIENNAFVSIRV